MRFILFSCLFLLLHGLFAQALPVSWDVLHNIQLDANTQYLQKISNDDEWNANAFSANRLRANQDGEVVFPLIEVSKTYAMGLSTQSSNGNYAGINYAFFVNNNNLYIYHNGRLQGDFGRLFPNDVLKIIRTGNNIDYRLNDVRIFNTATNASWALYIDLAMGNEGSSLGAISCSFGPELKANATISHVSCLERNTGTISFAIEGGVAPYSVLWNDNENGNYRNNLAENTYHATISDFAGEVLEKDVFVGNKIEWGQLVNLTNINDTLVPEDSTLAWTSIGLSENILKNNEIGYAEYEIESIAGEMIWGLSASVPEPMTYNAIQYGFFMQDNNLFIMESGNVVGNFGYINLRDKLRISKTADKIFYYLNGAEIYVSGFSEGELGDMAIMAAANMNRSIAGKITASFGCGSFYVNIDDTFNGTLRIIGAGLDETQAISQQSYKFTPTQSIGTNGAEMALTITKNIEGESPKQVTFYFTIDKSARISTPFLRKTIENEVRQQNLDPRFYRMEDVRTLELGLGSEYATEAINTNWEATWCFGLGVLLDVFTHLDPNAFTGSLANYPEKSRNWVYSVTYNYAVNSNTQKYNTQPDKINESIAYIDGLGRTTQVQGKNYSKQKVIAAETVYDAFGRPVLNTMPAPIGTACAFGFSDNFITAQNNTSNNVGNHYDYTNFDVTGKISNPDEVDPDSWLGKYYSENNTDEPYVSTTAFPYTRGYMTKGGVSTGGSVGEVHKMGSDHQGAGTAFPVVNELDHYAQYRQKYGLTAGDADRDFEATLAFKAIKSVSKDVNGRESVSFMDLSGNQVARALSGEGNVDNEEQMNIVKLQNRLDVHVNLSNPSHTFLKIEGEGYIRIFQLSNNNLIYEGPINHDLLIFGTNTNLTNAINADIYLLSERPFVITYLAGNANQSPRLYSTGPWYLDFHLPEAKVNTFAVTGNYGNSYGTDYEIWDLKNDVLLTGDPTQGGFYRIIPMQPCTVTYKTDYFHFTYNYFDKAGRLTTEVQPEGIKYDITANTNDADWRISTFKYHTWYAVESKMYDEDESSKSIHRRDGKTRFSQNALQATQNRASYILRDPATDRVIEFGEVSLGTYNFKNEAQYLAAQGGNDFNQFADAPTFPGTRSSQTYIYYDLNAAALALAVAQAQSAWTPAQTQHFGEMKFMLGLATMTYNAEAMTWNSYDELGRVKWTIKRLANFPKTDKLFTIEYFYDLAGNVKEVIHNRFRSNEAAHHHYTYDMDGNVLRAEFRTNANQPWKPQATYDYYTHGPLKRTEIGKDLQGIDYTYTTTGALKAINHPSLNSKDPGKDGYVSTMGNQNFAKDAFGMAIDYFDGDYERAGTEIAERNGQYSPGKLQWNGLIQSIRWNTRSNLANFAAGTNPAPLVNNVPQNTLEYTYDHLYQLKESDFGQSYHSIVGTKTDFRFHESDDYKEWNMTYDKSGNIKTMDRNAYSAGSAGLEMDKLEYVYDDPVFKNRLTRIEDHAANNGNGSYGDVKHFSSGMNGGKQYDYDALGNMIQDHGEGITITYNAYNDISRVQHVGKHADIYYFYDESGQRIRKEETNTQTNQTHTTWYVRDANGTLLSVYEPVGFEGEGLMTLEQSEVPIYALGRVGVYYRITERIHYELSDHLGNVRVVIDEQKDISGAVVEISHADYYAHGWEMPGRQLINAQTYKFAYQGIQKDATTGWSMFELRSFDTRTARWSAPDPYMQHYSPYLAMGNNPVTMIDPDGGFAGPKPQGGAWGGVVGMYDMISTMNQAGGVNDAALSSVYGVGNMGGGPGGPPSGTPYTWTETIRGFGNFYGTGEFLHDMTDSNGNQFWLLHSYTPDDKETYRFFDEGDEEWKPFSPDGYGDITMPEEYNLNEYLPNHIRAMKPLYDFMAIYLELVAGLASGQTEMNIALEGLQAAKAATRLATTSGRVATLVSRACFSSETIVITTSGKIEIKDLVGLDSIYVLTYKTLDSTQWTAFDYETITPSTWTWVDFIQKHEDGSISKVSLLRPNHWLSEEGINTIGQEVYMNMPEVGIVGDLSVVKIYPNKIDTRLINTNVENNLVACPVTGKFVHESNDVYQLFFNHDTTPLGATGNHPIWSLDRQDWIGAGDLRIGERMRGGDSLLVLTARKHLKGEHTVYNLEVYRAHTFRVMEEGIWVHNFCIREGFRHALELAVRRGGLTNVGRALDKHRNILRLVREGAWDLTTNADKNYYGKEALKYIIRNGTETVNGAFIEFKLSSGLGARFNATTNEFVGFLGRGL